MPKAEQGIPWPPTSLAEARGKLSALIKKPENATEEDYGHALTILVDLIRCLGNNADPEVTNLVVARVRSEIEGGRLPVESLDILGYEEEPRDWRE